MSKEFGMDWVNEDYDRVAYFMEIINARNIREEKDSKVKNNKSNFR